MEGFHYWKYRSWKNEIGIRFDPLSPKLDYKREEKETKNKRSVVLMQNDFHFKAS